MIGTCFIKCQHSMIPYSSEMKLTFISGVQNNAVSIIDFIVIPNLTAPQVSTRHVQYLIIVTCAD